MEILQSNMHLQPNMQKYTNKNLVVNPINTIRQIIIKYVNKKVKRKIICKNIQIRALFTTRAWIFMH